MFSQSNFGIVTKMGMWLMPAPATSLAMSLPIPKEDDIGWVIDTLAALKINGTVEQSLFVPSWLGALVLMGQRKDFYDGPGAMPDAHVNALLMKYKLGYWTASVRLYGDEKVNKAKAEVIRRAFKPHIDPDFSELWWHPGDPIPSQDPTMGVPSSAALQMADWVGGRAAHMGFSPVIPATGEHALRQLKRSRERIRAHDFDFYASFTIGGRFCNNINMLLFDRDNPDQVKRVRALFNDLVADAKEAGYGEYRTHLGWMDQVASTFDFNADSSGRGAMARLNARVKNALDPNGILAPGKQGIWPKAYAGMEKQGRIG
jgi:4-cresol dehydrogenase (hydroxylating)